MGAAIVLYVQQAHLKIEQALPGQGLCTSQKASAGRQPAVQLEFYLRQPVDKSITSTESVSWMLFCQNTKRNQAQCALFQHLIRKTSIRIWSVDDRYRWFQTHAGIPAILLVYAGHKGIRRSYMYTVPHFRCPGRPAVGQR